MLNLNTMSFHIYQVLMLIPVCVLTEQRCLYPKLSYPTLEPTACAG